MNEWLWVWVCQCMHRSLPLPNGESLSSPTVREYLHQNTIDLNLIREVLAFPFANLHFVEKSMLNGHTIVSTLAVSARSGYEHCCAAICLAARHSIRALFSCQHSTTSEECELRIACVGSIVGISISEHLSDVLCRCVFHSFTDASDHRPAQSIELWNNWTNALRIYSISCCVVSLTQVCRSGGHLQTNKSRKYLNKYQ